MGAATTKDRSSGRSVRAIPGCTWSDCLPMRRTSTRSNFNPVEQVWSHLEYGRLPNFVPASLSHLDQTVRSHLQNVGQTPDLLKALWHASKLPFPPSTFA